MIYNVPSKWVCTIYPKGKRIDTESADNAKTANTETYRVLCKKDPICRSLVVKRVKVDNRISIHL